jgi:hypothetical protein
LEADRIAHMSGRSAADVYPERIAENAHLAVCWIDPSGYAYCDRCADKGLRESGESYTPCETLPAGTFCDYCQHRFHGPAWWWNA